MNPLQKLWTSKANSNNLVCSICRIVNKINPDVVFCINDVQICVMYAKALRLVSPSWTGKSVAYVPMDARSVPGYVFNGLELFDLVLSITPNSVQEFENGGIACKLLEHPNVPNLCRNDTVGWRKKLRIPANDVVFLNIAFLDVKSNEDRKRIDICLNVHAFCTFERNGHLILKTSADLQGLQKIYSPVATNELLCALAHPHCDVKLPKRHLSSLIWASDVMLSTTSGEDGFPFLSNADGKVLHCSRQHVLYRILSQTIFGIRWASIR